MEQRLAELNELARRGELTPEQTQEWYRVKGEAEGLTERTHFGRRAEVQSRVSEIRSRISELSELADRDALTPEQTAEWYRLAGEARGLTEELPTPPPPPPPAGSATPAETAVPPAPAIATVTAPTPPSETAEPTPAETPKGWIKQPIVWVAAAAVAVLVILLIVVLGGGASATDPVPGVYVGGEDDFSITLTVDPGEPAISQMAVSIPIDASCSETIISGSVTMNQTFTLTPPLPVEDGQFELATASVDLEGRFTGDGTTATGTWASGDCSGSWDAEHDPSLAAGEATADQTDDVAVAPTDDPADAVEEVAEEPATEPEPTEAEAIEPVPTEPVEPEFPSASELEEIFIADFMSGLTPSMQAVVPDAEVRCTARLAVERLDPALILEYSDPTPDPALIDTLAGLLDECFSAQTTRDLLSVSMVEAGIAQSDADCIAAELDSLSMGDIMRLGLETDGELPDDLMDRMFDAFGTCGLL